MLRVIDSVTAGVASQTARQTGERHVVGAICAGEVDVSAWSRRTVHGSTGTTDLTTLARRIRDSLRASCPTLSIEVMTSFAVQIALAELRPATRLDRSHQLRVLGKGPGTNN